MKNTSFTLALVVVLGALPANAQLPNLPRPVFDGADSNADGQITAAEFAETQAARFKKLDTDGDGALTQTDRAGALAARLGAGRAGGAEGEGADGPDGAGPLGQFDSDGDKKITQAEFEAGGQKRFATADKDANAIVTKEELQALRPPPR